MLAVGIAQLAEHRTVAPTVAGSIPVSHPKFFAVKTLWGQPVPSTGSGQALGCPVDAGQCFIRGVPIKTSGTELYAVIVPVWVGVIPGEGTPTVAYFPLHVEATASSASASVMSNRTEITGALNSSSISVPDGTDELGTISIWVSNVPLISESTSLTERIVKSAGGGP